jgi:hypothetical protein
VEGKSGDGSKWSFRNGRLETYRFSLEFLIRTVKFRENRDICVELS